MQVYFREAGAGEGVVRLHSNASASAQWRALMDRLSSRFRVFAPVSLGAGKSPAWPQDRVVSLSDEVELLQPVFALAGSPLSLVGHSYGGAVALKAALAMPGRVGALAVYEPTLFSLLEEEVTDHPDSQGIRDAVNDAGAAIDAGDLAAAGARFIDYWMGEGTWRSMPAPRRDMVAASITNVRGWGQALLSDPTPLQNFAALDIPVRRITPLSQSDDIAWKPEPPEGQQYAAVSPSTPLRLALVRLLAWRSLRAFDRCRWLAMSEPCGSRERSAR